ncbi:hypothetical protein [Tissierella sp.]|uniref:hypothetical protein n=1 Tax=Tissierella sp. TaxID=41274 RepID=UPI00304BEFA3
MDIFQKLLIDIEKENKAISYFIKPEEGKKIEVVLAGKIVVPVPENEREHKIYKLLEENCDVIFYTTQALDDFQFYPVPKFSIFAVDSKGNCFGTIGGISNIVDDDYPVGYVNHKGNYGKIADSLKDFLELITFYPYWRDIIKYEQMEMPYDINTMEVKEMEKNFQYFARQSEIAEILKLSKNPKSIELLIANIRNTSKLIVYSSKDEAKKTNIFWDRHCLD